MSAPDKKKKRSLNAIFAELNECMAQLVLEENDSKLQKKAVIEAAEQAWIKIEKLVEELEDHFLDNSGTMTKGLSKTYTTSVATLRSLSTNATKLASGDIDLDAMYESMQKNFHENIEPLIALMPKAEISKETGEKVEEILGYIPDHPLIELLLPTISLMKENIGNVTKNFNTLDNDKKLMAIIGISLMCTGCALMLGVAPIPTIMYGSNMVNLGMCFCMGSLTKRKENVAAKEKLSTFESALNKFTSFVSSKLPAVKPALQFMQNNEDRDLLKTVLKTAGKLCRII